MFCSTVLGKSLVKQVKVPWSIVLLFPVFYVDTLVSPCVFSILLLVPVFAFFLSHDFSNVLSVLPLIVITCVPLPSFMSSFYYQTAF